MDVILLEKVRNLGNLGDQVNVKPGYGRNFLVPNGKAVPATKTNIEKFEARRAELEMAQNDLLAKATARANALSGVSVTISSKAGTEGKLYGSVGTVDISEAVTAQGQILDKHEVRLPNGSFRNLGEYEVEVHLHADVNTTVKVIIVAEA